MTARTPDFTPASLAARWGLHPQTLANWRVQGAGPPYTKRGKARTSKVAYPAGSTLRWGRENGYEYATDPARHADGKHGVVV